MPPQEPRCQTLTTAASLAAHLPLPLACVDEALVLLWANDRFRGVLAERGTVPPHPHGLSLLEMIADPDVAAFLRAARDALTTVTLPAAPLNATGGEAPRVWDWVASPLPEGGLSIALVDATDRVRANAALQAEQALHRRLADQIYDQVVRYDRQGRHIYGNQAAMAAAGGSARDYLGCTDRELGCSEPLAELLEQCIERVFATARPWAEVLHWETEQGMAHLDWRGVPEFAGHSVVSVLAVSRDVTASVEAERTLRRHEAELDAIYENAPLVMLVVDEQARARRANRYAQRLAAGEPGATLPCVGDYLGCENGRDAPGGCGTGPQCALCQVRQAMFQTFARHEAVEQLEATLPFVIDGRREEHHFAVSATPLTIDGESLALVSMLDISARRQAELALQQVNEHLEARVAERTAELVHLNAELQATGERERRLRQTAETLVESSAALTRTLDAGEHLRILLDFATTRVPADAACVLLPAGEQGYRLHSAAGDVSLRVAPGTVVGLDALPMVREVLHTHRPVAFGQGCILAGESLRSGLAIPLIAADHVTGVCMLGSCDETPFDQEQVRLAVALAGQAATAVQIAWLFDQVQAARERLQNVARGLVEVQESERRSIARELHDESGQTLAALSMGLQMLERDAGSIESIRSSVGYLRQVANGLNETLHRLAVDLRPPSLDAMGLEAALRQYLEHVSERYGLAVGLHAADLEVRLAPEAEIALYRIVQEAVANVARHAKASRVDVLLRREAGRLILNVEDDGVGYSSDASRKGRLGIVGMQERVEMLGGTLVVEGTPGAGTIVRAEIPEGDAPGNDGDRARAARIIQPL